MARPGNVDHVQTVRTDGAVQMHIYKVLPGRCAPVAKQPGLDMFRLKGLPEQRVVEQINLADRQIIRGPPIRVHSDKQFLCERLFFGIHQISSYSGLLVAITWETISAITDSSFVGITRTVTGDWSEEITGAETALRPGSRCRPSASSPLRCPRERPVNSRRCLRRK